MSATRRESISALIVTIILTALFVLPQAVAWLPVNEIMGPEGRSFSQNVKEVTIQGWGFFTKSPRELQYRLYRDANSKASNNSEWVSSSRAPNNQLKNWFGLDRTSRLQEFDVSILTSHLQSSDWVQCGNVRNVSDCAHRAHSTTIADPGGSSKVCGRYLVTRSDPLPWSYRNLRSGMPGEVVIVNVPC